MAKRRAEKALFPDKSEEEDEPETPGVFETASEEVLATRTLKKAKRTLSTTAGNVVSRTPFAGFSFYGNGKTDSASTATSMTSSAVSPSNGNRTSDEYLSKVAKLNRDILDCITRLMDNGAYLNLTPCFEDYMKHFQRLTREEKDRQRKNNNGTASHSVPLSMSAGNSLAEFASPASKQPAEMPKPTFSFGAPMANKTSMFGGSSAGSLFKFDSAPKAAKPDNDSKPEFQFAKPVEPVNKFSFGTSSAATEKTSDSKATQPSLSFGGNLPSAASSLGVGQSPGFSFGLLSKPAPSFQAGFGVNTSQAGANNNNNNNNEDDEEDQPPKVDIAPVEEEGSLYTKKVKLYYKKQEPDTNGAFAEKGVGFLHIKPLDNGGHQLLVRAQTTLGNVLLNIRIGKDLPVSRMKSNNVAIICVPNPPLNPLSEKEPPTMFLIRVKSKEDADELHDKLVELKGAV